MSDDHSSSASEPDFAAISAPAEQHARLAAFVGTFRAEVKIWMGPGDPAVSTGTMTNTMDLGGRFLKQHYVGDPGAGPGPSFEGRGYWGFNKTTNKYEGFWIDTASTLMQTETGDVDEGGKVWTMIGEVPNPQGGSTVKKSIITLQDDDRHSMETFFEGPDGSEAKGMEIQYTRAI